MAEVVWTVRAIGQLDEIAGYIALDKPGAAGKAVRQIYTKVGFLATAARLGRPIPELPHPNYRMLWVPPCWIYYRIDGARRLVLHVRRAERPLQIENLTAE